MSQPPTVLIVDDEENVAEAYSLWLSENYDTRTAYDGDEALEKLDDDVDVILLDRRMPNLSGDDTLDKIREHGYDCRVAMVTAVDPDFDILEMGFDAYLTKPVTEDELNETVERLLTLSDYNSESQRYFELAEKKATLEAEKSKSELERNDEYVELTDELEELKERMDETVKSMGEDALAATFRNIENGEEEE
ncbi:MAG: response regulator [Halobacteria archaeon]|nr:response regulator [Halobacteria archaeon]